MDTAENFQHERKLLAKMLRRFSLSYEQHQMLDGPGIGLLASQVATKRRRFTVALAAAAVLFAVQAGRGVLANRSYIAWFGAGAIVAVWCFKRHAKTRMLQRALSEFAKRDGEQHPVGHGLADELRLHFKLQYDEHQAVNSGKPELAAEKIIQRCHENTWASIKGAAFFSAFTLVLVAASLRSGGPVFESVGAWVFITTIAFVCAIVIAINDRSIARKVDRLSTKHRNETQDIG